MQIGLLGFMFLVMFALKLMGTITVSWWLVTAPLWGGIAVVLSVAAAFFVFEVYREFFRSKIR